jgi:type II secretory pathway component PulJ
MREDGYTLAEALAALLMISLAVGGLLEGMDVIGKTQARAGASVEEGRSLRAASENLASLVHRAGAVSSDDAAFAGDARRLDFDCPTGVRCAAVTCGLISRCNAPTT